MRGFRHLINSVGKSKFRKVLVFGNGDKIVGEVMLPSNGKSSILFFQNRHGNRSLPSRLTSTEFDMCETLLNNKYHYYLEVNGQNLINQLGGIMLLLPEDFDKRYEEFAKQNKKLVDKVFERMCSKNDFYSIYIYALTEGSPNLFVWAMTNIFKHGASFHGIKNCINWCINYPQLIKNLSKGTPTAYNGRDQVLALYNEMVTLRKNKRVNDTINMFNTAQKKMLKSVELTSNVIDIFSKFYLLSYAKQHNFVRKMSTIDNADEILRQMSLLTKAHFEWNKESFFNFIKNVEDINCEVVLDRDNLVIVKVNDYDTIKYLAKTTNWCISKNKKYWNDYVGNRRGESTQYVLFDFSKDEDDELSIVGFTTLARKGIVNAHSFSNENLMYGCSNVYPVRQFTPFRPNIFYLLKLNNVSINNFVCKNQFNYEWNIDSFIEFAEVALDDSFDIVYQDDNKIAIITENPMVRFIVGEAYNNIAYCNTKKCVIFADFSKDQHDDNRLLFVGVNWNNSVKEEKPTKVFNLGVNVETNIPFDNLLEEYNLPYNIICRTENKLERFISAFSSYNVQLVDTLLKDKDLVNTLKTSKNTLNNHYNIAEYVNNSIFNVYTIDMLKVLYDNNVMLSDIMNSRSIDSILSNLIYEIGNLCHNPNPPTQSEMELLFSKNRFNYDKCKFIGFYMAADLILKHEKNAVGSSTLSAINDITDFTNLCIDFTNKVINKIGNNLEHLKYIISSIIRTNNTYALAIMLDSKLDNELINYILSNLSRTHELYPMAEKAKEKLKVKSS